jgi:transcriptional regulator with XRE-family HTH domain
VAPHSSPTVKRRRLAAELRRYRDTTGLTIEQVAEQLEWSSGKISKIENARVSVLPRDVKFLLGVYGVEDGPEREVLLALARESRQRGWWQQYGDAIPEWFEVYVGLEAEATSVSSYHGEYVPGLLQTEDYARAVHQATLVTATDEEIERRVQVRIARQSSLRAPDGPQLWIVLNEAVLRRQVGGRAVMRKQLTDLIEASKAANITLQVLPFSAGAHAAMDSPFRLLEFADAGDPAIVYVEYASGSLYLERPAEVARYRQMFDHLRAASLPVTDSRRLLTAAADELA